MDDHDFSTRPKVALVEVRHRVSRLVPAAVALGAFSWLASRTKPFTISADIYTAIPIAFASLAVSWQLFGSRTKRLGALEHLASRKGREPTPVSARGVAPWILLVGIAIGWELFSYFSGPRSEHPTLSSLYNVAAGLSWIKASFFALWVLLGAYLLKQ